MRVNKQLKGYRDYTKADKYILGFEYHGTIYMAVLNNVPSKYLTVIKASHNRGKKIQFNLTMKHKRELINKYNALPVMLRQEFDITDGYNNGDKFESIVRSMYGIPHQHDNVPFYKGVDLLVNGVGYSIKYENAQLCMYSTVNRLLAQE